MTTTAVPSKKGMQFLSGLLLILVGTYLAWLIDPDPVQIVAAISGLLCVWMVAKESIWNYPLGLVNIVALIISFFEARLYADFTLNIIFFILNLYGWYFWLHNRGNVKVRPTRKITAKELCISLVIIIVGTPLWGYVFSHLGAAVPYPDSFIMVTSILAQWFLSKKVYEHWYFWFAVDLVAVPIYFVKDLSLIAILYLVYLGIVINGIICWKKEMG